MHEILAPEVESILDCFRPLEDPRSTTNQKHLLGDLIVISICAVVAGADGPKAIGIWALANQAWLKRFAISLLKQMDDKESIAMRRRMAGWNPEYLSQVLGLSMI